MTDLYFCLVVKVPIGSPDELRQEVFFAKDVIQNSPKPCNFNIIYRAEKGAILSQQVSRELQPRVHHAQPVRVEPTRRFRVARVLSTVGFHLTGRSLSTTLRH
jgi:hypothetical protein